MGGRGLWAQRRRQFAEDRRDLNRVIRSRATFQQSAGGGGAVDGDTQTITLSNGARVTGSESAIKRALGNEWTLESAAITFGASKGSTMRIEVSGNRVDGYNSNPTANISSHFSMVRDSQGVTFNGDSLFTYNRDTNNLGGKAILPIVKGLRESVNSGRVNRFSTYAIGDGNSATKGSQFWAEMGASTSLSRVNNLPARPTALQSARTVAELIQMPGGKAWWRENRRAFNGSIDFRQTSTPEYKLASKFLGLGRTSRRRS